MPVFSTLKERATVTDRPVLRGPFEAHPSQVLPARDGRIGVHLSAECLKRVTLIGTWPSGLQAWLDAVGAALGSSLPDRTGLVQDGPRGLVMRTGPEEFLLIGNDPDDPVPALRQLIPAEVGSVTDLSHARCRIRIQGHGALETLSKLFALDFRPAAFPLGETRLTGHHHLPWVLHRVGEQAFDAYVYTSYAHDQLHTLMDAAREYGVSFSR
ncbi:MAG: hypothetical protein FGM55_12365 [Rhodoferax sp.]|nr:hypothetical protein [Rhodoferax sp.]